MINFNKEAAFFGGLFAIAFTLVTVMIGFTINISSQGDAYTAGEAAKQGHNLGLYDIVFILVVAVATGFIKRKK